ncbi:MULTISPECIES: ABC transporter substrate-binding protein [unclassified Microbacterium]|uniref:ABC transporter substrate-binding protein n=1 Tax=unclassified Microbacterium TaxID=2609290 RepID=UPI00214C2D2D|nr:MULTISPECIES: ABC transporter substrate-binding protein [unclassified Microbacterium]MCR2785076.1 ABC transporter substrate-binding protein [Microbacterium sp. zg.B96]WIM16609.1 ABC transporter substrate-binding protein [Microbacterium sp. zg-B96]
MNSTTKKVGAIAAVALLLAGCAAGTPEAEETDGGSARGGLLTIGQLGDVASWDPAQAHVGHALVPYQLVYDTLILREPDGALSPMLATEWKYNDDRTVLTLELRDDVTFSDGEAFDAEAVAANLEHFKASNGRQAVQLTQFESATPVDEDTVEISLVQPDPAMEYYLSQAAGLMASPAAIEAGTLETDPVGTGPYLYDKVNSVRDSQSLFTAKEDYWNSDLQKWDEVELRILGDISARVNAIISGQVDWTTIEAKSADQAEGAGLEIIPDYQVDWTGMTFLDRDGVINPALTDERVRQAINYAVDRDTLLEQLQLGRGTATSQVFGPDSGAFVDDLEEYYTYDPEKATELLEEAGYADGFELKLPVIPAFATQITALAQQLGEVGITVTQETVPQPNYVADVTQKKFEAFNFNLFQGEAWVAINQLISPTATFNPFGTTDPELEALISVVQQGGDDSAEAAQDVNRYVTENAWFLPLYRIDQISVFNPETVTVVAQTQSAMPSIYNFSPAE